MGHSCLRLSRDKLGKNDQCIITRQKRRMQTQKLKLSVIFLLSPTFGSIIHDRADKYYDGRISAELGL